MATSYAKGTKSALVPSLRYQDAHKGIEFLVNAFGFEKQAVYEGPGGTVMHAQLTFGGGMLMLGSADNGGEASKHMVLPSQIGGKQTMLPCLIVTDAAAVYAQARAAGAVIVQELAEMDYGGKAFACLDPEGYCWSVGEYDPWT